MCIEYIYRHIRKLLPTKIFTTRDMLIYGSRSAVDAALHRMVKGGFIIRLARGVFVRDDSNEPSIQEIATAKAKAFKTQLKEQPESVKNKLVKKSAHFVKEGHSQSFGTIRGRVYIKGISARKWNLLNTNAGQVIYTLWVWGRARCTFANIQKLTSSFGRWERVCFWQLSSIMPAWLTAICRHRYPPPNMAWT